MVPRYTARLPYLGRAIREQEAQYSARKAQPFDFNCAFWTPPLTPRQAYRLEEKQIQRRFQLPGFVSLTDHDDIRAAGLLQVLNQFRKAPVSVEWTVPFGSTFFHLGVHNLPVEESRALQVQLAKFTANPAAESLADYLKGLTAMPGVLVVLNHPLWDEKGIGAGLHQQTLLQLLQEHGNHIHALELNGLRSWHENKQVISLARQADLPVISGGDRHGREPNAIVNLTPAASFTGFVEEVRYERRSHVVFMPQYREPIKLRVLQTMVDVVREYPENVAGRRLWSDRVFFRDPATQVTSPLSLIWSDGGPRVVKSFLAAMRLFDWPGMRAALRIALDDRAVVWSDREASIQ